jgi:hypothetical protein
MTAHPLDDLYASFYRSTQVLRPLNVVALEKIVGAHLYLEKFMT